jgi:N-acetylmuramoyl-L-alanine amidase
MVRAAFTLLLGLASLSVSATTIQGVRVHESPDATRIVLDTSGAVKYKYFNLDKPHRVVIDVSNVKPAKGLNVSNVAKDLQRIKGLRGAPRGKGYRLVIDAKQRLKPSAFTLKPIAPYGHRLVIDLASAKKKPRKRLSEQPKARPSNRDVVIVIDAGHGGEDPGALGPKPLQEKHLVLQIAKRTAKAINAKRGYRAVLTRTGDYYIAHRKRTALAREARADLFVSIHADAFTSAAARGASVYTLSDRGATSETAKWLAERANQSDLLGGVGDVSLSDKDDVLAHVLLDLSMDGNRSYSIDAGQSILNQMGKMTKLHKKRVEQAAFLVLKSPDMPSILVETGFISNPQEARRLSQKEHQNKLARAIADGIDQFMRANPPPGTALAARRQELRHTIARGDTLSEIATRYGVSATALKRRNAIRGDRIRIGQTLFIPQDG